MTSPNRRKSRWSLSLHFGNGQGEMLRADEKHVVSRPLPDRSEQPGYEFD